MKDSTRTLLMTLAALSGCERANGIFTITDPQGSVASAELRLCGSRLKLIRSDHRFSATKSVGCEGEGDILVRLSDGRETVCHIGYVTPGAKQDFEFVIERGQCVPRLR
jgi:hypothetical protein